MANHIGADLVGKATPGAPKRGAQTPLLRRAPASRQAGIQVISRATDILRSLDGEPDGMSLGEIASRVGLARSTVQRIVSALVQERLLMLSDSSARVMLGPLILRFASNMRIDVIQIVKPVLERLSRQLGETVDLSIFARDHALFIDQIVGPKRLSAVSQVGKAFPLANTANGKAILAGIVSQPPPVRRVMQNVEKVPLPQGGQEELEQIIETKIAFDRNEHSRGVSAVGTWFFDSQNRIYAISIPVPTVRFKGGEDLVGPLLEARVEIGRLLATER